MCVLCVCFGKQHNMAVNLWGKQVTVSWLGMRGAFSRCLWIHETCDCMRNITASARKRFIKQFSVTRVHFQMIAFCFFHYILQHPSFFFQNCGCGSIKLKSRIQIKLFYMQEQTSAANAKIHRLLFITVWSEVTFKWIHKPKTVIFGTLFFIKDEILTQEFYYPFNVNYSSLTEWMHLI